MGGNNLPEVFLAAVFSCSLPHPPPVSSLLSPHSPGRLSYTPMASGWPPPAPPTGSLKKPCCIPTCCCSGYVRVCSFLIQSSLIAGLPAMIQSLLCPSPFITGLPVMNGSLSISPSPIPFITGLLVTNVVLTLPSFYPPLTHSPDWLWGCRCMCMLSR